MTSWPPDGHCFHDLSSSYACFPSSPGSCLVCFLWPVHLQLPSMSHSVIFDHHVPLGVYPDLRPAVKFPSHRFHPLARPRSLLNHLVSHLVLPLAASTALPVCCLLLGLGQSHFSSFLSLPLIKVMPPGLYTRSALSPLIPSLASVGPQDVLCPITLAHPLPTDKFGSPTLPPTPRPHSRHNTDMQIVNLPLSLCLMLHCPLLSLSLFNKSPHPLLSPTVPLAACVLFPD